MTLQIYAKKIKFFKLMAKRYSGFKEYGKRPYIDAVTGHLMVYDIPAMKYVPKTVDLHQSTGSSKTGAMSQYAVTKALNEINNVLFTQYTALTFSRTPSVIERGVNTKVTLTWNPTFNGAYEKPSALTVKKGDTTLTTDTSLKTIQDTEGITETTAYSIEATIKGITKTASATVNAYYPQFAGASASESLASADMLALGNKVVAASVARTVTMEVAQGQYFWFAVPENFSITSIKMGGFDVSLNDVATVAVDGRGNYKCYRSAKPQSAGRYTFEIK